VTRDVRHVGVLLAGGAGAFIGLLIADNTSGGPRYTPEIFGQSLPTLNTLGVFCAGVALGLIFCLGVWLIVRGTKHGVHRRTRRAAARGALPLGSNFGAGRQRPS
jgi:cytochrome bd-type quinol oxidase subunit 2